MRGAMLLPMLAACGRLDFVELAPSDGAGSAEDGEEPTDAASSAHDEDGDGLVDAIDPCPHLAGAAEDRDFDGVGDACDPNPDVAIDHLIAFTPFTPESEDPFESRGPLVQNADDVECPDGLGLFIKYPVATSDITVGFEIVARVGTGQHQVALGAETGVQPYYFGELNDSADALAHEAAVVEANGVYTKLDKTPIVEVHPGVGSLRLRTVAGLAPRFALEAGWPGELYRAAAATPMYVGAPHLRLVVNGLDIKFRYVFIVESQ